MRLDRTKETTGERSRASRPRALAIVLAVGILQGGCAPVSSDPGHDADALARQLLSFTLPIQHAAGEASFERWCVSCHGPRGAGSAVGPPLVHRVYRPAHHGDAAFRLAVSRGVRAHHWTYGDMPPVPEVATEEIEAIVGYLRWLQRQVGIE